MTSAPDKEVATLLDHDEQSWTEKAIAQKSTDKKKWGLIIIVIVCLLAAAGAIIGVVVSNSGSKDGGDSDDPVDDVWKSEAFEYDALIQINEAYSINEN